VFRIELSQTDRPAQARRSCADKKDVNFEDVALARH
jgi:hypothetical protein